MEMANRAASKLPPMAGKKGYAAYLRDSTLSTMARRSEELKNHG